MKAYIPREWRDNATPEKRQSSTGATRQRYPVELRARVRKLTEAGATYDEVFARTQLKTRLQVRNFCKHHGIPMPIDAKRRRAAKDDIELIRVMLNIERLSYLDMEKRTGWSRNRIVGIAWRYGLNGMMQKPEFYRTVYGHQVSFVQRRIKLNRAATEERRRLKLNGFNRRW